MSRLSLRGRVTLAAVLVLAAGLAVLSVVVYLLLAGRLGADATSALRSRAEAQLATLDLSHGGLRVVEGSSDAALDRQAWVLSGRRIIERPAVTTARETKAVLQLAGVTRTTERTVGTTRLRAVPVRDRTGVRRGTVVVGISLVPYQHTRRVALVSTLVLSVLMLVGAAIAVRWSVRSALRPVAEMTARAADWSEHDLHQRFHLGPPHDELTALAATFDALLRRIEGVLLHEQRFSAEVAHELRTPLTGLRGEAELALLRDDLDGETRAAFERVADSSRRMQKVIDTLLASVRPSAQAGPAASADPVVAIDEALAQIDAAARSRGVDVHFERPANGFVVEADGEFVARALQPLLENAVRHARASVSVELSAMPDNVVIAVRDDGEGLGGRDPDSVFTPGVSTSGGAGLGLSLARRLARSCGGDVVAVPAAGGRFEVRLPGARAQAREPAKRV